MAIRLNKILNLVLIGYASADTIRAARLLSLRRVLTVKGALVRLGFDGKNMNVLAKVSKNDNADANRVVILTKD